MREAEALLEDREDRTEGERLQEDRHDQEGDALGQEIPPRDVEGLEHLLERIRRFHGCRFRCRGEEREKISHGRRRMGCGSVETLPQPGMMRA